MKPALFRLCVKDEGRMPEYATFDSSGADLFSAEEVALNAGVRAYVSTGVWVDGYVGTADDARQELQVRPKSGNSGRSIDVIFGTIDADYRGEIKVLVVNNTGEWLHIQKGVKIAQLVCCYIDRIYGCKVREEKRFGGFGSTGV